MLDLLHKVTFRYPNVNDALRSDPPPVPANEEPPQCERCWGPALGYYFTFCSDCLDKAARGLSELQLALLERPTRRAPVPLEPCEVPAATGLQARGLALTVRDGQTSTILAARRRYKKGSRRWLRLTQAGREVASRKAGGA